MIYLSIIFKLLLKYSNYAHSFSLNVRYKLRGFQTLIPKLNPPFSPPSTSNSSLSLPPPPSHPSHIHITSPHPPIKIKGIHPNRPHRHQPIIKTRQNNSSTATPLSFTWLYKIYLIIVQCNNPQIKLHPSPTPSGPSTTASKNHRRSKFTSSSTTIKMARNHSSTSIPSPSKITGPRVHLSRLGRLGTGNQVSSASPRGEETSK